MDKNLKFKRNISIILFLVLILIVYCYAQNNWIKIENMRVEINNLPKELNGIKIAHISDVHLPKNASNIDTIVNKVKEQKPDIIVMTGDIIDSSANLKTDGLEKLCKGLSEIAATYAVTGNHEILNDHVDEWTNILTANNVKVINNKIEIYTKNNKNIAIAGLPDNSEYKPEKFIDINKVKNMPMILLAHRPELFNSYSSSLNIINPSIIFSGHAHGGQIRIPFINQAIYAPKQGFFPKYTSGVYSLKNNIKMIVSRGLGNSIIPIRINDRPQLPIVELYSLN